MDLMTKLRAGALDGALTVLYGSADAARAEGIIRAFAERYPENADRA